MKPSKRFNLFYKTMETISEPTILETTQKQDKEFLERIHPRNVVEGKTIIRKYNWTHSLTLLTKDCDNDFPKFLKVIETYLKEREDFLHFMSKYL